MRIYKAITNCLLLFVCSSLQFCNSSGNNETAAKPAEEKQPEYYTMADFDKVEKYDVHSHIDAYDTSFVLQAKKDNLRLLTVNVDAGEPIDKQRRIAEKLIKLYPDRVAYATTFNLKNWGTDKWLPQTIAWLKESFDNGAIAVKVWKNIGMELKDANGKWVMIDDPRFDSVINFIQQNNITLMGHLGEPKNAWLPIDSMTVGGDRSYFKEYPQYHQFLHPENPSYQAQIDARDNMLAKHPNLRFVGAHLASLEWNVDELAKRLDRFPNIAVEMAARITHLQVQSVNNWQKVHDFLIKYKDRLIYGTDMGVEDKSDFAAVNKDAHDVRLSNWQFFVTNDEMTVPDVKGSFKGQHLPKEVVDKIFKLNAEKWYPGLADLKNHAK